MRSRPLLTHAPAGPAVTRPLAVAIGAALVIAALYELIYLGVLSVGRADAGELGILGVAGGVFVVLALALWRFRSPLLWGAVALLQLLLAAMYVAVAPERDPAFEVWGLTIRAVSVVLLGSVVALLVTWLRHRRSDT